MAKTKITKIRRRDGTIQEFNFEKLENSIKAAAFSDLRDEKKAIQIAKKNTKTIIDILSKSFGKSIVPSVEDLRDIIATVLGKQKDVQAAKLGMALLGSLVKQKSLKTLASFPEKNVDDAIVRHSNKKVYIATQDKELKKRVKEKGAKVITLKQKKYLSIE